MRETTFTERLVMAKMMVKIWDEANPQIDLAHLDQAGAAGEVAHRSVIQMAKTLAVDAGGCSIYTEATHGRVPPEVAARCIVALAELKRCPHLLRGGPQPAWGKLALHRIDCERCAATVRLPPPGEDDRCDWCEARGVAMFTAVAIQSGPAVLIGDACSECADALRWFESEEVA